MQILCITGMINTLFECDIYRFICTRKILAEKMMSETFFSLTMQLPGASHVLFVFLLVSAACSINSELGNQWSLENCLEISPFHQTRLGLMSVLRPRSSY